MNINKKFKANDVMSKHKTYISGWNTIFSEGWTDPRGAFEEIQKKPEVKSYSLYQKLKIRIYNWLSK